MAKAKVKEREYRHSGIVRTRSIVTLFTHVHFEQQLISTNRVIAISSWRLATIIAHQAGWEPQLDFTFYAPISILLACLEVDIAVLAASMPVFWPIVLQVLQPILVTHEVHVTREPRWRSSEVELECASMHSEAELHRKSSVAKINHYNGTYTVDRICAVDDVEHPADRTIEVHGKWDGT
jgi:hypothetical protein